MKRKISVAIDGPAGAGKSSVSRAAAQKLGFIYIDTGAMYRACALYAIQNNIKINEKELLPVLDSIKIAIRYTDKGQAIYLNGEDVSGLIRSKEVSMGASQIALIPAVRLKLVELQRELAKSDNVIMDGRDIGTYVLPEAEVKIYLTASVDVRAKRRYDEMTGERNLEDIKKDIIRRDENDMNREFAPLKKAEDACVMDTSDMAFDEVVKKIIQMIKNKQ